MKIIYVRGDRKDDALNFRHMYGVNPSIELWNKIKEKDYLEISIDGVKLDIEARALEFGDVDPLFIGFIKSALIEETRNADIFIVKE
jgi:hypothetical protein